MEWRQDLIIFKMTNSQNTTEKRGLGIVPKSLQLED